MDCIYELLRQETGNDEVVNSNVDLLGRGRPLPVLASATPVHNYAGFGWDSCDKGGWYNVLAGQVDDIKVCPRTNKAWRVYCVHTRASQDCH